MLVHNYYASSEVASTDFSQKLPRVSLTWASSRAARHILCTVTSFGPFLPQHLVQVGDRDQLEVAVGTMEIGLIWRRQIRNWRTVVIRQIFNRFFTEFTLQYVNIYITLLGASPVQLGAVNSVMGVAQALTSIHLGVIRDRFNIRKIYLFGVAILVFVSVIYAVAPSWEVMSLAILLSGLFMMVGSCVLICDLSLPPRDRATGKALC